VSIAREQDSNLQPAVTACSNAFASVRTISSSFGIVLLSTTASGCRALVGLIGENPHPLVSARSRYISSLCGLRSGCLSLCQEGAGFLNSPGFPPSYRERCFSRMNNASSCRATAACSTIELSRNNKCKITPRNKVNSKSTEREPKGTGGAGLRWRPSTYVSVIVCAHGLC